MLLVMGAGPVAKALAQAYLHIRPGIGRVLLWNRTPARLSETAAAIRTGGVEVQIVEDLDEAVAQADIISTATAATSPLIRADKIKPGTHIDLVGGYRPDMQELQSEALRGTRIFVDDRSSASASGDLQIPLREGVIEASQIEADLFELCQNSAFRRRPEEVTVYKNAGGAHLDLIVSQYLISRSQST